MDITQGRLWIRLMKKQRMQKDLLVPCRKNNVQSDLQDALLQLDIANPLWLSRHENDWEQFSMAHFKPEHFPETVDFDVMELSFIAPEKPKK